MAKLNVTNLKKSYGNLEVLKSIDLQVTEGEVVCLIGPSGSGKSTLLRCLNMLEEVTSGEVVVNDFKLTDKKMILTKSEKISEWCFSISIFSHI